MQTVDWDLTARDTAPYDFIYDTTHGDQIMLDDMPCPQAPRWKPTPLPVEEVDNFLLMDREPSLSPVGRCSTLLRDSECCPSISR